jgi:hypothetical protein
MPVPVKTSTVSGASADTKKVTEAPTVAKPAASSAPAATNSGKPAPAAKPAETAKGTVAPADKGTVPAVAAKPESTQAVNPDKFKEELKKALGKIETAAKPEDFKTASSGTSGKAETVPVKKLGENSFQEQLKKALDPAASLADSGEAADIDDIDTELPADDEDAYDTTFAFPGGTFMQVSPSRKVIRYHSEGRRDPFSPLVGKDRFAGNKKRRAVPAAEQLRLVGIMRSLAGNKALLEDGEGNGYILAPGERVRNGYLVSVSENKVLFQVTEYGWTKTVAMELAGLE